MKCESLVKVCRKSWTVYPGGCPTPYELIVLGIAQPPPRPSSSSSRTCTTCFPARFACPCNSVIKSPSHCTLGNVSKLTTSTAGKRFRHSVNNPFANSVKKVSLIRNPLKLGWLGSHSTNTFNTLTFPHFSSLSFESICQLRGGEFHPGPRRSSKLVKWSRHRCESRGISGFVPVLKNRPSVGSIRNVFPV